MEQVKPVLICFNQKSFFQKGTHPLAHFAINFTRRSPDTPYGGENLYDPSKMESFCEEHAPGMLEDIFDAIFNNEKRTPSQKRRKLQKSRFVAVLQNLSFFGNQVVN